MENVALTTGIPVTIVPAGACSRPGVAPSLRRPSGGWPFAPRRVAGAEKQAPFAVVTDHNWTGVSVPNELCRRRS
jgi:hypothetical protein